MAATKLNPAAPPFPSPYAPHLGSLPPSMLPFPTATPPPTTTMLQFPRPPPTPVGAIYFYAQFPVPSPHHPFTQFPVLHPSRVVCKAAAALPARFLRKAFPAKPARAFRKAVPEAEPATKVPCKDVPAEPADVVVLPKEADVAEPAPHGLPPHKLMVAGGKAKKLQAAADDAATERRHGPAPAATTAAAPDETPAARSKARSARRKAERRRSKKKREGAVVGPRGCAWPRAWTPSHAFAPTTRLPPPSKFTTPPRPSKVPPSKARDVDIGSCTTVMVRNIPNRLKCDEMIALLDDHCARANRAAGAVVSAYDVVYLPMDFRTRGNFGYAFVNFTTSAAAQGLCNSLQGCGWKGFGSGKTIDVLPAKIQGREALERHLSRHKFECHTKEYLPAVFSPARDGGERATAPTTQRVGKLVPPRHVKKKAYAVRGQVQA